MTALNLQGSEPQRNTEIPGVGRLSLGEHQIDCMVLSELGRRQRGDLDR